MVLLSGLKIPTIYTLNYCFIYGCFHKVVLTKNTFFVPNRMNVIWIRTQSKLTELCASDVLFSWNKDIFPQPQALSGI